MNLAYLPMHTLGQNGNLASSAIVKVKGILYFRQGATLWFHNESQLLIGVWLLPGTFLNVWISSGDITRSYCDQA